MNLGISLVPMVFLMISDDSDREFMEQLYTKYHKMMMRMAQSLCHSTEDAEDVVSESLISLITKIPVLRHLDRNVLEGYIISVVKNTTFMLWRKKKNRHEVELNEITAAIQPDNETTPEEKTLDKYSISLLMTCIGKLKEEEQVFIRMRYYEKRSNREIAAAFEIEESHVRTKLTRIRKKLMKMISEAENCE